MIALKLELYGFRKNAWMAGICFIDELFHFKTFSLQTWLRPFVIYLAFFDLYYLCIPYCLPLLMQHQTPHIYPTFYMYIDVSINYICPDEGMCTCSVCGNWKVAFITNIVLWDCVRKFLYFCRISLSTGHTGVYVHICLHVTWSVTHASIDK